MLHASVTAELTTLSCTSVSQNAFLLCSTSQLHKRICGTLWQRLDSLKYAEKCWEDLQLHTLIS